MSNEKAVCATIMILLDNLEIEIKELKEYVNDKLGDTNE